MAGRPDFSTPGTRGSGDTVAVSERPEIDQLDLTQTTTVNAGATETIELYAPTGSIYEPIDLRIMVPPVEDSDGNTATGGGHIMRVRANPDFSSLYGRSSYDTALRFQYGSWFTADQSKYPASDAIAREQMNAQIATENSPLRFEYFNDSDAAQAQNRAILLTVKEMSY